MEKRPANTSNNTDHNRTGHNSKDHKIRRAALDVIMVCLALIAIVSGYRVYTIMHGYKADQKVYEGISEIASTDDAAREIDFDSLREVNPDIIGWLRYDGTVIDYPVVKGEDNDKYLHTLFEGTQGGAGTLFADSVTYKPFEQFNTIIYGHHMRDGSMFGSLKDLKDQEYCKEHPKMELFTPDADYDLVIWAFLNEPSDSEIYSTNFSDKETAEEYIRMIKELSEYTMPVKVTPYDRLVVLSTCAYEYENARYIVVCKLVQKQTQ